MKALTFSILFSVLLVFGCGEGSKKEKETNPEVAASTTTSQEGQEEVKFPVYNFKEFETLLKKDDSNTYIINFWATWCKPCIEEMPYFERVNEEYKDKNVKVLLVSLDMPSMWKSRLEPFVENKNIQSEVVILDDPKQHEWIPKVAEEWGGGIPATLIYNANKRNFYEQGFTYEELTTELNQFIN